MKKIALLLAICFIFTSFALCVSAVEDEDIGIHEGAEYVKGELIVWTTTFFDPAEFEGDGPFDFLGISITRLEVLISAENTGGDVECYFIKLADGIDTIEALEILQENEIVMEVGLNYIAYPDDGDGTVEDEDIGIHEGFKYLKGELTVWTDVIFDADEFKGEGPFDFFGVSIVEIHEVALPDAISGDSLPFAQTYHIELADGVDTIEALEILRENENIKKVRLSYIGPVDYQPEEPDVNKKDELEAIEGVPFVKGTLLVWSTQFFDSAEFKGEGPFDFLGVSIVKFRRIVEEPGELVKCYSIKVADGVDTLEAYKILEENEIVKEVAFDKVIYPVWEQRETRYASPFIGMSKAELAEHDLFVSDEFVLCLNEELDLAEFEDEGPNYLYGVCVEEITRAESENEDSFIYNVKLGEQHMWNCDALTVFECNDNVISVAEKGGHFIGRYGNGDIDQDGDIDASDYILVKRMCLTYDPTLKELGYADVNMDGKVHVDDYVLIKRHCLKTYDLFAVEEPIVD